MKFKTLCSAALAAAITLGVVAPVAANAETHSVKGKGKIEYTEDSGTNTAIDPEKPEKEIEEDEEEITVNTDGGAITIDVVSNLDFGTTKIGVSPIAQTYKAKAVELTQKGEEGEDEVKVTRGHFVQWTDKRAGNDHSYEIRADLTQQFKNGTNLLGGATIAYSNGMLNSVMDVEKNWPVNQVKNITLTEDGGSIQVLDNLSSTDAKGLGTYTAEFGQSADDVTNARGDESLGLAEDSVVLTVPAGLSIVKGVYEAEITWSIAYTPAPTVEEPSGEE